MVGTMFVGIIPSKPSRDFTRPLGSPTGLRAFLAASLPFPTIFPMYREQKHFLLPNQKNSHSSFLLLFPISIKYYFLIFIYYFLLFFFVLSCCLLPQDAESTPMESTKNPTLQLLQALRFFFFPTTSSTWF
jgi:hypothetical protein